MATAHVLCVALCMLFVFSLSAPINGPPCAKFSKLSDLPSEVIAGNKLDVQIITFDCNGQPLTEGGYKEHITILLEGSGIVHHFNAFDLQNGTYAFSSHLNIAGSWKLSVSLFNDLVAGKTETLKVLSGDVCAQNCEAIGTDGLSVFPYETSTFKIQARDCFANPTKNAYVPSSSLVAFLHHTGVDKNITLHPVNNGDGSWSVDFVSNRIEATQLYVLYENENINGSPFSLTFQDARPYAPQCIAYEFKGHNGLVGAVAGETAAFVIETRDKAGNRVTTGGRKFAISIQGRVNIAPNCYDQNDGLYVCYYDPTVAGRYEASVSLEDFDVAQSGPIYGSPFHPIVIATDSFTPNAHAYGHNLHNAETNEDSVFYISTFDEYMNQVQVGGEYFNVLIKGPDCTFANQTDFLNGTYAYHFSVSKTGDYKVYVNNRGVNIPGSPFDLHVENPEGHHSGLSGGAIAGIVIGCVAGALIVVVLIVLTIVIMRRRRSQITYDSVS